MNWINYSDDELEKFHPVFQLAADRALDLEGLDQQLEWKHHLRTPGNRLVPDFVLRERDSRRWLMALEIKRSKQSLHSTRNQIQAKGYAESNLDLYYPNSPKYFAITNLEQLLMFAIRDGLPPNECRLRNGLYEVGVFADFSEDVFTDTLNEKLRLVCRRAIQVNILEFDDVWPSVLSGFINHANLILGTPNLSEPNTNNWETVRDYFCHPLEIDTARLLLFRCLVSEFILGVLRRFGHPQIDQLLELRAIQPAQIGNHIANVLSRIRNVDFKTIFEESWLQIYRNLANPINRRLADYIQTIVSPPSIVRELAQGRLDHNEFIDGLILCSHLGENLDEKGKVTTDPELASLLAYITINNPDVTVLDPCCGDGALLEGAYTRLTTFGIAHNNILTKIYGIEADPLLSRLAYIRLMLKDPASIQPDYHPDISYGDMFAQIETIKRANVILMNPPFRRYEAQDLNPVPELLKAYYASAITDITGLIPHAIGGQQNLFAYYVEFVLSAAEEGTIFGIILDNKWYHNKYGESLKKLILSRCAIEAIIEYPYSNLFRDWTISTSILLCRKTNGVEPNHDVKFIRCSTELAQVNPLQVAELFQNIPIDLNGWTCKVIKQNTLDYRIGWKNNFENNLTLDFRDGLAPLPSLFHSKRRGSLAKEEGGMSPISFPFSRHSFGYVREAHINPRRRYQTQRIRKLTSEENTHLTNLTENISAAFRGYALENSDTPNSFILDEDQLIIQPTIEPPSLRMLPIFWGERRTEWTQAHETALNEINRDENLRRFISTFRDITGLNQELMPNEWLWVSLKEPYAGELIIPRKLRIGHRVYVNPYACNDGERQVRISSNFISFSRCLALDEENHLDALTSTKLIAAFLTSSFGHLQIEMCGYNREGCLSVELHHLENVKVIDPRIISAIDRDAILEAFSTLPYPIPTNVLSAQLPERNNLDRIFSKVICSFHERWSEDELLNETYDLLDEYLLARNP